MAEVRPGRGSGNWAVSRDCCLSSAGSAKALTTEKTGDQGQSSRILDESASPVPLHFDVVRQNAPPLFLLPGPKRFQASARGNPISPSNPRSPFPDCALAATT